VHVAVDESYTSDTRSFSSNICPSLSHVRRGEGRPFTLSSAFNIPPIGNIELVKFFVKLGGANAKNNTKTLDLIKHSKLHTKQC
jgi:hypothetical protein